MTEVEYLLEVLLDERLYVVGQVFRGLSGAYDLIFDFLCVTMFTRTQLFHYLLSHFDSVRWQCLKTRIVIHNKSLSIDLTFSKFLLNFLKPPQQCGIVVLIYDLLEWFS